MSGGRCDGAVDVVGSCPRVLTNLTMLRERRRKIQQFKYDECVLHRSVFKIFIKGTMESDSG